MLRYGRWASTRGNKKASIKFARILQLLFQFVWIEYTIYIYSDTLLFRLIDHTSRILVTILQWFTH